MNNLDFEKLSLLLMKQIDLQNKLLTLENHKTKVLTEGNIEKLDEVLRKEQPLVLSCAGMEKQREQLLQDMGLSGWTLKQIIGEYDPQNEYGLQTGFKKLEDILHQLSKSNETNHKILQSRLSIIGHCLSLIGLGEDSLAYQADGHF